MMEQSGENAPVYSFLSSIKNYPVSKACVLQSNLRTGKTGNLVVPSIELYLGFVRIHLVLGAERALYSFIVYCDCWESSLP